MKETGQFSVLLSVFIAVAMVLSADAQTLVNEDFQTPDFPDNQNAPAFAGWTVPSGVHSQDGNHDGAPLGSTNQVIHISGSASLTISYDTTHNWVGGETYVLAFNASPQAWSGTMTRYGVLSLMETNGTVLWTSGSILMPLYETSYQGNPWGDRQTFSNVIKSDDFSGGTPGEPLRLRIGMAGARGLYFDNVSLVVTTLLADVTAPTPDPMTWVDVPVIVDNTNITMKCTYATDDFPYGVQHYFENTNTGVNSGWQDGVNGWTWTEYDLAPGTTNSYRCKARDKSPSSNETAWSSIQTVIMPAPDTTPPNPDPMTFAVDPMVVDSINVYMEATTAVDAEYGVEYYFENVNTGSNSGWQASTIWAEQYQSYDTPLSYRVKARDISPQTNETAWSTNALVTIPTPTPPDLLVDASFQVPTYSAGQADPFYVGWTWDNGAAIYVRNGNSGGCPGPSTNKVIEINNQGPAPQCDYPTGQAWTEDHIYTLTINAAPNSWGGSNPRYLETSLFQTSDDTTLWLTNVPVPLYTNDFQGADPWPTQLTFSFTVNAIDFTTGSEGEPVSLKITQTGQRSLYIDNVHLVGFVPPPSGTVLLIK